MHSGELGCCCGRSQLSVLNQWCLARIHDREEKSMENYVREGRVLSLFHTMVVVT